MNADRFFPKDKRKDDSAFFKTSLEIGESISSWKELEIQTYKYLCCAQILYQILTVKLQSVIDTS